MRMPRTSQPLARTLSVGAFLLSALLGACRDSPSAPTTGSLAVTVSGLPDGAAASVSVSRGTTQQAVTGTRTVQGLEAGEWVVSATTLTANGTVFAPQPVTQTVSVNTKTLATARVTWVATTGSVAIVISGLPVGVASDLVLSGPGNLSRVITGLDTVRLLEPGTYQLLARDVRTGAGVFRATFTRQDIYVAASATPVLVPVQFEGAPGAIDVEVLGLPASANAAVVLTSPTGTTASVTRTARVIPASAGRWQLAATVVRTAGFSYAPTPSRLDTVLATADTLRLPVTYTIATGALAIAISGLPTGAPGALRVSGPGNFARTLIASTTYADLTPGVYTVSADSVALGGTLYRATAAQAFSVVASTTPVPAPVRYATANGTLVFAISGLPPGIAPSLHVQGPLFYDRAITASAPLTLPSGTYTVTVNPVSSGTLALTANPRLMTRVVPADGRDTVRVAYQPNTEPINWLLDNVYLTQAVQRSDGSVPLVAGRDALLRAFVRADRESTLRPVVRARLYDGTTLVQTVNLTAPIGAVPTSIAEGTLGATFNAVIPAALLRPGLRVLVDVDPETVFAEATRIDNVWPTHGTPQLLTVSTVPAFTVRFVPITASELTGNVTDANMDDFLRTARMVWPLAQIRADLRTRYTSSVPALQATDANRAWITLLSEINALRVADGAPSTTHYYGVLKVTYTSGVAGYGFVPGRTAIGWDYLPSGDGVAAHEWGHNFNRPHAPCGTAGNPDPSFPHLGGAIGVFGWNRTLNTVPPPTTADLMGYCRSSWISDFSWTRALTYRQSTNLLASVSAAAAEPRDGLLVWGRIVDGAVTLEPAFRVRAPITRGASAPTHVIEAFDDTGTSLISLPISAELVDHATEHTEQQFAAVVPWSAALEARLARVQVRDVRSPLLVASRTSNNPLIAPIDPALTIEMIAGDRRRIRWDQRVHPMVMVREQRTGTIVGFVRTSGTVVRGTGERLEYVVSDGVRSVVR